VGSFANLAFYEFSASFRSGIAYDFTVRFPNHTSVRKVKADVMATMPRDSKAGPVQIVHLITGGTCAFFNVTSPTLARRLGIPSIGDKTGVVGIHLTSIWPQTTPYYNSSDVYQADVYAAQEGPSLECDPPAIAQPHLTVPNLVGLNGSDAVGRLSSLGFSDEVHPDSELSKGVVIAQSPSAGTSVPWTTIVELTLGPRTRG
jgi:hypothetical protein